MAKLHWVVAAMALLAGASAQRPAVRFTSRAARWLYTAPRGPHVDLSRNRRILAITLGLNTAAGGYDYPVQTTRGPWGATWFDDFGFWGRRDRIAVPNVAPGGCGWRPSSGSDGHLLVLDTRTRRYYDFWRLCVNAAGCAITCRGNRAPTSIGEIKSGSLAHSDGTPGDTAAQITGLAGVILPGELQAPGRLRHALALVVSWRLLSPEVCHAAPATHSDGAVAGAALCEGGKLRLDPAVKVMALAASPASKAILLALQRYGGVIVDQSGCGACLQAYTALPGKPPDLTGIEAATQHFWLYKSR